MPGPVQTFGRKLVNRASFIDKVMLPKLALSQHEPKQQSCQTLTESKTSREFAELAPDQKREPEYESDKILREYFNEESATVSSIGDDFIQKMQYVDIYKNQSQLEAEQGSLPATLRSRKDPHIMYYLQCKRD